MTPLIGIVGLAGSGKSSLATELWERHGFRPHAFSDPIKAMAATFVEALGVRGPEVHRRLYGNGKGEVLPGLDVTTRHVLQTLGTEWGRTLIAPDVWTRIAMREIDGTMSTGTRVVVDDVRTPDEAFAIKERGGLLVRVVRRGVVAGDHATERLQAVIPTDWTLLNAGPLASLAGAADDLAGMIGSVR